MQTVLIALASEDQPEWLTFHLSAHATDSTIELAGSDIIELWKKLGGGGIANKVFLIRFDGETYLGCRFIGRAAQAGDAQPMELKATFLLGSDD